MILTSTYFFISVFLEVIMTDIKKDYPDEIDQICPIRYAMGIIGQKWKIPILWHLADDKMPLRFRDFKKGIPCITDVMLSKSLHELEYSGIIHRQQYDCIPPKVEYTLTERGKELIPVLYALHNWGRQQYESDKAADRLINTDKL